MANAINAAEQAILNGDEEKLYEALKGVGVQNLQPQNKGWYLKQLQAERESKEQVGEDDTSLCKDLLLWLVCITYFTDDFQASPGEALTKDELQSGVDVANEIADSYQKCVCINDTGYALCCSAVVSHVIHNTCVYC